MTLCHFNSSTLFPLCGNPISELSRHIFFHNIFSNLAFNTLPSTKIFTAALLICFPSPLQNDVYEDEPDEPCYGKRCTANEYCCPGSVCVNVDGGKDYYYYHHSTFSTEFSLSFILLWKAFT